jgi:hypothetical protein
MAWPMTDQEERRRHRRRRPEEWPYAVFGRIRPGHQVRIIDLSVSGALIESARRLSPGGWAELHLESGDHRHTTRAAIVRCSVSDVHADAIIFRSALALEHGIPWLDGPGNHTGFLEVGERSSTR